jgi:hypothetical protein
VAAAILAAGTDHRKAIGACDRRQQFTSAAQLPTLPTDLSVPFDPAPTPTLLLPPLPPVPAVPPTKLLPLFVIVEEYE